MDDQKGKNNLFSKQRDETPPKVSDRTPEHGDEACNGVRWLADHISTNFSKQNSANVVSSQSRRRIRTPETAEKARETCKHEASNWNAKGGNDDACENAQNSATKEKPYQG